ncbi:4-hydroxy-tetrahydrodipicolinate synthase [Microtetraspora sp. NBRC 13810]|uniref:4-hydroxy-tetrahydrodipicolinate synthase n=1 Tax=Microtetraspora sp. NBRC 13810 TaxID=3030990 RepID=UPI0024A371D2|nr:4-hydroxy-tetrahydrodipicolinate synthase [Microtetraspora sp. NBRC 13810]GLW09776.1 4-hydroxy-tetrahydrodipicolinate synthase [Microtetraspora sp. NBRC 13810]
MDFSPTGLYVPLVTPFAADGSVAAGALEALAHRVLDGGAAGVVALGTTAEPAALDPDERRLVLDVCARVCRERSATLIAGAGSNDTRSSLAALEELGKRPEVAAALVVVPYFTRPSEEGVLAHFTALADGSPVPLIVYNIPYRTGRTLGLDALRRLGAHPRVAGTKHAVGGVDEDTVRLLADPPPGFAVLAGDDLFAAPLLALGAPGAILASAHLRTDRFAEMVAAWRTGDLGRARALGHRLAPLSATLFAEPNPAVVKAVLHAEGAIPTPMVRLPLLPATPAATRAALRLSHPD